MSSSHTQTCYLSPQGCPFPAPLPPTPASLQHHQEGVEWNQVETFHVETLQGLRPVLALAAKRAEKTAKKPWKTPHDDLGRSPQKKTWKPRKNEYEMLCIYNRRMGLPLGNQTWQWKIFRICSWCSHSFLHTGDFPWPGLITRFPAATVRTRVWKPPVFL